MKVKKTLFLVAGIIRVVVAGIGMLFSLIAFLARKMMRSFFDASFEMIVEIIKETSIEDNSDILAYSRDELLDYMLLIITIIFIIVLIISIIWLIFGIINIRLASGNRFLQLTKGKTILLLVFSWTIAFELLTNIMITIAVCIKNKGNREKLYTQANTTDNIEVK